MTATGAQDLGPGPTSWVRVGNGAMPWIGIMSDRQNNRVGLAPEDTRHETAELATVTELPTITERNEADEFRAVVMDNMAEGLYTLDALGRVTYLNAAASQMLGWTKDELHGKPMHEIVHFQQHDGTGLPAEDCALLNSPHPRPNHPRRG